MSAELKPEGIGIIVLAAGSSKRFGQDKRTTCLSNGKSILENTLDSIPDSFSRKILVLKADDGKLASQFSRDWEICMAENPTTGLSNSLASGIALASDWQGALIALGDMPFINPETFSAIQHALTTHTIVIPTLESRHGNPVGLQQRFFPELKKLKGDKGAKSLLKKYISDCFELKLNDEGIVRDIDNPEMIT